MTDHGSLVQRALKWLRNTRHCTAYISEMSSCAGEQPDAIGWCSGVSILVECKVSKADFKADADKPWRRIDCLGMGQERYYLCPPGLIASTDLPTRWGLLWACDNRLMVVRRSGTFERCSQNEIRLLCSAVRRYQNPKPYPGKAQPDKTETTLKPKPKKETTNMAFDASKYGNTDSKWLKAVDLEEEEMDSCVVVITDYAEEVFKGRDGSADETKLTVKFKEFSKPLVMNKTNTKALIAIHGSDADEWLGKRCKLFVTLVNNPQGGPQVKSLGISSAPLKRNTPPADAKAKQDAFSDE